MLLAALSTVQAKYALLEVDLENLLKIRFISGAIAVFFLVSSPLTVVNIIDPLVVLRSLLFALTPLLFLASVMIGDPAESTAILFIFPLIVFVYYELKIHRQLDLISLGLVILSFVAVVSLYEFGNSTSTAAGLLALLAALSLGLRIIVEREALAKQSPNFLNFHSLALGSVALLAWDTPALLTIELSALAPAMLFAALALGSTLVLSFAISVDRNFNVAGLMYLEVVFVALVSAIVGISTLGLHNVPAMLAIVIIGALLTLRQQRNRSASKVSGR